MPRPNRLTFELLETLVELVNSSGDAILTSERLGINQSSMSKRLKLLQQSDRIGPKPWIKRSGKVWSLTIDGERNLSVAQQILRLEQSLGIDDDTRLRMQPTVSIACGQTAVTSILKNPLNQFRSEFKDARVRISTPRGTARIKGVANGTYDFALVTHDEADIQRIAGRPLCVEKIHEDPFVLVCGQNAPQGVRRLFETLASQPQPLGIDQLIRLPLILPEPDAGLRRSLDRAFSESDLVGKLDIVLEVGGWSATLDFVRDGWGVGIVTKSAIVSDAGLLEPHPLEILESPPTAMRLIARLSTVNGHPDLLPESERLMDLVRHHPNFLTSK